MNPEPIFDLAHLALVEWPTPKLEESTRFFIEVMGMTETERAGDSVYLRGWDDYEHHSLQLSASTNMPFSRPSSSMYTNPVATASRSPTPARG